MDTICITAEQAKSLTATVPPSEILDIANGCLKNISLKIEEAASKGYNYIVYNIYQELSERIAPLESSKVYFSPNINMAMHRVTDYLETAGYLVRSCNTKDEIMHRISWGG